MKYLDISKILKYCPALTGGLTQRALACTRCLRNLINKLPK